MQTTREEQTLPPEASMSGKNAFYHPCDVRGGRPHYGVCLFTIDAYEKNRLNNSMEDCARAIKGGECPALALRAEERKAGRALYFQERKIVIKVVEDEETVTAKSVDKTSPSYLRGFKGVKKTPVNTKATRPKLTPKAKVLKSDFERGMNSVESNADVINTAAKQEQPQEDKKANARKNARAVAAAMFAKRS